MRSSFCSSPWLLTSGHELLELEDKQVLEVEGRVVQWVIMAVSRASDGTTRQGRIENRRQRFCLEINSRYGQIVRLFLNLRMRAASRRRSAKTVILPALQG